MTKTKLTATLALAALALTPLACSDDGPSKEEFIADGDRICLDSRQAADGIQQPDPADPATVVPFLDSLLSVGEQERADFAKLEAPDDGQDLLDDYLATIDDQIATVEEAQELAGAQDFEGAVASLNEAEAAGDDIEADFQDYGFEECGRAA